MDCIGGIGGVEWSASCFGGGRIWEEMGCRMLLSKRWVLCHSFFLDLEFA